jgi:hypothetical protein
VSLRHGTKGVFNMNNNMIMVRSASDWTVVVDIPYLNLHRVWTKRDQKYPIERSVLLQAYYDNAVEALFRKGTLVVDDKDFLREVGLLDEEEKPVVYELTDAMKNRIIKLMPVSEVKKELAKMSDSQLEELGDYAVIHYQDLLMDRIDILSKATGKNIIEAIKNFKAAQEG